MSGNESEADLSEYLILQLDAMGKLFDEGPFSRPQNPNPMTPEECINHLASHYPPDDPITKKIQDNLIDDLADIAGADINDDADRLSFMKDLQQKVSEEGIDALDPAILNYLADLENETHTATVMYSINEDGSKTLIAASFDGQELDIEELQKDKPDNTNVTDHIFDKFFNGELPEIVGSSNGGATPDSLTPDPATTPGPTTPEIKVEATPVPGGGTPN